LGVRYLLGEGVAKDATEGVKWMSKAAEQGNAEAQYNLGVCYAKGDGVAKDDVTAYMWTNLAAASGAKSAKSAKSAKELRELLEKKMTAEQIAEAQLLSRDWKPRPYQGE
jgi:TPR repeat protein